MYSYIQNSRTFSHIHVAIKLMPFFTLGTHWNDKGFNCWFCRWRNSQIYLIYGTDVRSVTWDENLLVPRGLYTSYVVFEYTNVTTTSIYWIQSLFLHDFLGDQFSKRQSISFKIQNQRIICNKTTPSRWRNHLIVLSIASYWRNLFPKLVIYRT